MQTKVKGIRVRKLALTAAVLLTMSPQSPYALGLSDAELHSSLDETLDARIRLLSVQPGDLEQASIRLASPEVFARAGVERSAALSALHFEISKDRDGMPIIRVTSSQPIKDPYLDFLVELNWPAGRLVRGYTLLLDPPVTGVEKAPPVARPAASAGAAPALSQAGRPSAPAPEDTRRPSSVSVAARQPRKTYGPTRNAETLWNIAEEVRPDNSVTVHQMMVALVRNNPEAFFDANVNRLKAGHVLRVPEKEWIGKISAQEAALEVQRQLQAWRERRSSAAPPAAAAPASAPRAPRAPAASQRQAAASEQSGKLRLVAPDQAKVGRGGDSKLNGDLALALETVDATQRENEELRKRLAALEQQLGDVQRAMNLKSSGLAQMQGQAAAPPAKPEPEEVPPEAAATPAPAQAEPSSPNVWTSPSMLGGMAGALVLFGAAGWLVARRRRGGEAVSDREQSFLTQALAEMQEQVPQSKPAALAADSVAIRTPAAEPAMVATEAAGLDALPIPGGDIDPVVEADVYLAYRRYQQAETLMLSALQRHPQNPEYRAKLLEVYYAAKNDTAFAAHAEHLFSAVNHDSAHPVWNRVMVMGQDLCPRHALFRSKVPTPEPVSAAAAPAANPMMDLSAIDDILLKADKKVQAAPAPIEPTLSEPRAAPATEGDNSLDFSWGSSVETPDLAASAAPVEMPADILPANQEVTANGLDFDLGGWTPEAPTPLETPQETLPVEQPAPVESMPEPTPVRAAPAASSSANWDMQPAMSDFADLDFRLDDGDLLAGTDVVGTKLDLAKAYIDMGDQNSASDILKEVLDEGTDAQKQEAQDLMKLIA